MSQSLLVQLSQEWEALEKKVCLGLANRHNIANFLRTWTLKAGEASADEKGVLLVQIQLASQTLNREADNYEALIRNAREKAAEEARREADRKERDDIARAEQARRRNEQWDQQQRDAAKKLEKTREETRAIERETERIKQEGRDHQTLMNRVLTNPELYCPHCHRAYADHSSAGCPHCTIRRYPYY